MISVTAAVITSCSKILCAKRSPGMHLAGFWEFPGGKIESGETPQQCLQRELKEEFTIDTEIGEFVAESVFDYGVKHIRLLAYRAEHLAGEFELIDHDETRWLFLDELESLKWTPADVPIIEALKQQDKAEKAAEFYRVNAKSYFDDTVANNVAALRYRFAELLPKNAKILDLGCGSGRDSKAFIEAGFNVTALEASPELAVLAQQYIGHPVLNQRYQALNDHQVYEGIWACASLLHCPKSQISYVLQACANALKPDGVFYFSFKEGEGERLDEKGRFFNDYTLDGINEQIGLVSTLEIIELSVDTGLLRGQEQTWINGIVRKV